MLTGNKNLDSIILNKLDDKDLVNLCQTNRQGNDLCNDQSFWLNRIMVKFPYLSLDLLKEYKGDRTWSQYYINDLRKINKFNKTQYIESKKGRIDQILVAINKGDKNKDTIYALSWASYYGNLNVVKYLVENGVDLRAENDYSVRAASQNGRLKVVKYLVENGADFRAENDYSVRAANRLGYIGVVDYLVEKGSFDPRV